MSSAPQVPVHDNHAGETTTQGRRGWWRWIVALCLIAVISALAYVLVLRPPTLPAPYQGADTANDELAQVATDPTGGVWAIGYHYDRPPDVGVSGVTQLSTFVLHLEGGTWVKRIVPPSDAEGVQALAMRSASEGWLVGGRGRAGVPVWWCSTSMGASPLPTRLTSSSPSPCSRRARVGPSATMESSCTIPAATGS